MRAKWHSLRRALLILVLGYAAFLRLYRTAAAPPGLYRDEAMNGNNAREALETRRLAVFYPENGGREGLYIDVAAAFVYCFGNEPWALRLPAALFGVLTVWGVYLVGMEWFGGWIGVLTAFFLATSFWHVNFSRIGLRAIAAPCFLAWAVYLLLAGMRRSRLALVAAAGVVYGLGFYTYIAYRATPLLLAAILARGAARVRWVFGSASAVVAAPLVAYFVRHPGAFWGRSAQVSVLHRPRPAWEVVLNCWRTARMFFRHGDANWRHNIAWRGELFWPVSVLFALGVVIALTRIFPGGACPAPTPGCSGGAGHARPKASGAHPPGGDFERAIPRGAISYGWPLTWLAVAALPVVLSGDVMPHALRSLLMAPAVFLLTAVGVWEAYTWLAPRIGGRAVNAAAVALAAWLAWEPYHSYFQVWAKNPHVPAAFDAGAVAVARRVREMPKEVEKVVVVPESDPMAAQPVMFLTESYTETDRQEKRIRYVTRGDCAAAGVFCLEENPAGSAGR